MILTLEMLKVNIALIYKSEWVAMFQIIEDFHKNGGLKIQYNQKGWTGIGFDKGIRHYRYLTGQDVEEIGNEDDAWLYVEPDHRGEPLKQICEELRNKVRFF